MEKAEVIGVAYAGNTAEQGAGEAALSWKDECAGDVGCGWEATEIAALEGEEA